MSNRSIWISLDESNAAFRPGDELRGKVHVSLEKESTIDSLPLVFEWYTHGKGNKASSTVRRLDLFQGKLFPGHRSYDFVFTVPDGPFTYHGHYLNVDWQLRTWLDIPWAIDPKFERRVAVFPTEGSVPALERTVDVHEAKSPLWVATILLANVTAIVLLLVWAFGSFAQAGITHGLIGLGIAFVLGWVGFGLMRNRVAETQLGTVTVTVEPMAPGDDVLHVILVHHATPWTKLNAVTATFVVKEEVVRGSGTDAQTFTHGLFETEGALQVSPTDRRCYSAGFELEPKLPPSFAAPSNALLWDLTLHVDIALWPDWLHTNSLTPLMRRPS
ncbi:MAG: hypothetical protein CO108_22900 [Deltaproteobacteria bacterium CG_4_9_14_3_um_filter_63_12]|nr:MAG: hypothetical protein CO108_22900 [Deltaproteobacteria bacterium CG_4_9_14_3_um_filter_63_12]